jgi:tetratricopeptide (TPR) repeat protein
MKALFDELRRRKVFRTAVAYLATAFVALQVADLTFEPLGLTPAAYRILIALVAIGFPIALVLSWAFDLRSELPRTGQQRTQRIITAAIIVVGAMLVAGFAITRWDAPHLATRTVSNSDVKGAARVRLDEATYDTYVRARFHISQGSEENLDSAVVLLQRVIQSKPDFAGAHAALAIAYMTLYSAARSEDRTLEQKALVASERALALDPHIPEAHIVRGRMLWTPGGGFAHELAAAELQHALALDPNHAEARAQLASIYTHVGLMDEALIEFNNALRLNPIDPRPRTWIGQVHLYRGDEETALTALRATPASAFVGYQIAWTLARLGRLAEAQTQLDEHVARFKDEAGVMASTQALIDAKRGNAAAARRKIAEAEARRQTSIHYHHTAYNIGAAFAQLQQPDSALYWLRAAANRGLPCYTLFNNDPELKPLRSNPEFRTLLADLQKGERRYRQAMLTERKGGYSH